MDALDIYTMIVIACENKVLLQSPPKYIPVYSVNYSSL